MRGGREVDKIAHNDVKAQTDASKGDGALKNREFHPFATRPDVDGASWSRAFSST